MTPYERASGLADWEFETNITDSTQAVRDVKAAEYSKKFAEFQANAAIFSDGKGLCPMTYRQIQLLLGTAAPPLDAAKRSRLEKTISSMTVSGCVAI